ARRVPARPGLHGRAPGLAARRHLRFTAEPGVRADAAGEAHRRRARVGGLRRARLGPGDGTSGAGPRLRDRIAARLARDRPSSHGPRRLMAAPARSAGQPAGSRSVRARWASIAANTAAHTPTANHVSYFPMPATIGSLSASPSALEATPYMPTGNTMLHQVAS